jgi:hypothetical protein
MEAPDRQQQLRHALETFGDPRKTTGWPERNPDYVASLEVTSDDVAPLLTLAREWLEPIEDEPAEDDFSVFALLRNFKHRVYALEETQ